jgi:hypothetical protein
MKDLLTVVVAGEASPETRELVQDYAAGHPEFARAAELSGRLGLDRTVPSAPDHEMEALRRTKGMLRLKSIALSLALVLTLFSLRFRFEALHVTWGWQGDPAPRIALLALAAVAWVAYALTLRRLRFTGL